MRIVAIATAAVVAIALVNAVAVASSSEGALVQSSSSPDDSTQPPLSTAIEDASTTPLASTADSSSNNSNADDEACELNGSLGIGIQITLSLLGVCALIIKRSREENKRPFLIWFFDVSKQGMAAIVNHFTNIWLGLLLFKLDANGDKCSWYFVSYVLDCTIGTFTIYKVVGLTQRIVLYFKYSTLVSGEYGHPPKFKNFGRQLVMYLSINLFAKIIVALICISSLMHFVISFIETGLTVLSFHSPTVKVIYTLFLIPMFLSTAVFWITDNIVMRKKGAGRSNGNGSDKHGGGGGSLPQPQPHNNDPQDAPAPPSAASITVSANPDIQHRRKDTTD